MVRPCADVGDVGRGEVRRVPGCREVGKVGWPVPRERSYGLGVWFIAHF